MLDITKKIVACIYLLVGWFVFPLPMEHLHLDNLLLIQTQYALCHHLASGTTAIKENQKHQWLRWRRWSLFPSYINKLWMWAVWGWYDLPGHQKFLSHGFHPQRYLIVQECHWTSMSP